jgi:hypothetical protein
MTYIAAWLLLSLIGLAAWFCLTPFTEDDDVHETTAAHDVPSLRAIHGQRALSDAGEENDACPRSLAATNLRSE